MAHYYWTLHLMQCIKVVLPRSCFIEFVRFLNLEHKIATVDVFHYKKQPVLKDLMIMSENLIKK